MKEDDKMLSFITQYWIEFAFGIATSILTIGYKKLYKMIKDEKEKNEAIADGMQALLRDRILQAYNHYMEKGFYPIYARENVDKMVCQYTKLKGNGVVKDLVIQLHELPISLDESKGSGKDED